jgi:hypothetical protein
VYVPNTFDKEQYKTVTDFIEPDFDESIEGPGDDPPSPTTELVRLTDTFRDDKKFCALKDVRYTPVFREMLQRPTFAAFKNGECPEFFETVRAAYASCYYLSEDAQKQDIVEQATAEALKRYVGCDHGLIKSTCTRCESTKSAAFELPFSVAGLKKLAVRICERLKKNERKRSYPRHLQTAQVEQYGSVTDDARDNGMTESDTIAVIDAERGHVDAGNENLMRLLVSPQSHHNVRPEQSARSSKTSGTIGIVITTFAALLSVCSESTKKCLVTHGRDLQPLSLRATWPTMQVIFLANCGQISLER